MSESTEPTLRLRAIALLAELGEHGNTPAPARESNGDGLVFYDSRDIAAVERAIRQAEERGAKLSAEAMGEPELRSMAIGFGNILRDACGGRIGFGLFLATRQGTKAYAGTLPRGFASVLMKEQVQEWFDETRAADAGPPAVHVLHAGLPLCGKFPGLLPIQWPEGHRWVRVAELDKVTCDGCRGAAVAFKA